VVGTVYQSDRTYEGAASTPLRWVLFWIAVPWVALVVVVVISRAIVPTPDTRLANRLNGDAIRAGGQPVLVSESTTFAWDRVCFFRPFTSAAAVEERIGASWSGLIDTDFPTLVFVLGDDVARYTYLRPHALDEPPIDGVCRGREEATVRWRRPP
jgi:hypothetical protein